MRIALSLHFQVYVSASNPLSGLWRHTPAKVVAAILFLAALGALITQLKPIISFLGRILQVVMRPFQGPDSETRYRIHQRRLFARHVVSQLQLLATREDWHDERFADLEAEVEVEGRQRTMPWLRHSASRTVILRREKSLSRALEHSGEPLIVLEGDPGAGKSVALRHLAENLADKARRSREISKIPLYINLKEFRPEHRPVDSNSVYDFILASINRVNDRDVERFLDEEFDRGLRDGSWLILLDSFDEIPDILSSTEADNVVEEYALAIHNFLFGMHGSRAVVASREFRGPKTFRVPRFQIVALSAGRQADLIRRSGLHPDQVRTVEGGLATADPEIRQAATNPMFLGLICEYARVTGRFPESSHSVYESYLTQRFARDAERMQTRYKVSATLVRAMAEEIAFSMAAIPGLGLSPTRQALHSALINTDQISLARLDAVLDALEYTKLGRAAEDTDGSGRPSFTFAHRRFQEYFATCVVIRHPERVSVTELLTDGRWRETVVTILQTQQAATLAPLLEEATRLLAPMMCKALEDEESQAASGGYCWPPGSMHLLGVLSAGLGQRPDKIPADFRTDAGSLLMSAWNKGRRHDKKWAASLALVACRDETTRLLEQAFASGSVVLGGAAYTCVSRLPDPSPGLYEGVRKTLVEMAAGGDLIRQKVALNAQVHRLPEPISLIQTLRLLSWAPKIDYGLAAVLVLICAVLAWPTAIVVMLLATVGLIGYQPMLSVNVPYRILGANLTIRLNSGLLLVFAVEARLVASALTIAAAISVSPRNWIIAVAAIIAGTFFACWPPAVGYVCRCRSGTKEFLWPLIPLFALAGLLQKGALGVRRISSSKLRRLLIIVLSCATVTWAAIMYGPAVSHNSQFRIVVAIIAVLVYGALVIAFLFIPAQYLYRRRNDTRLVHSLSGKRFAAAELFKVLGLIKTQRGVRLFIESTLRIDLIAYPEVIRILSDLAAAAEVAQAQGKKKSRQKKGGAVVVPGVTTGFADWLKAHSDSKGKARRNSGMARLPFVIRNIEGPMLDQIARAIERSEMARGSTLSAR